MTTELKRPPVGSGSKTKKPKKVDVLLMKDGSLAVALTTCCDETEFCIDVRQMKRRNCIDSDHDCSGLPRGSSMDAVKTYLNAALDTALELFAANGGITHAADKAARAGCAAVRESAVAASTSTSGAAMAMSTDLEPAAATDPVVSPAVTPESDPDRAPDPAPAAEPSTALTLAPE